MEAVNQQVSEWFSGGDFSSCYDYFSDEIEWKIIGNRTITGKENVISYCEQMKKEMASSTLTNYNTISESESIMIEGRCTFPDGEMGTGEVSYCDVYRFKNGKISRIHSYCI